MSEAWYSEELQTLLLSMSFDPRVGETTYKLTDIQRREPPRALFEVPADYVIENKPVVSRLQQLTIRSASLRV